HHLGAELLVGAVQLGADRLPRDLDGQLLFDGRELLDLHLHKEPRLTCGVGLSSGVIPLSAWPDRTAAARFPRRISLASVPASSSSRASSSSIPTTSRSTTTFTSDTRRS